MSEIITLRIYVPELGATYVAVKDSTPTLEVFKAIEYLINQERERRKDAKDTEGPTVSETS